jgi:hypothetical protein
MNETQTRRVLVEPVLRVLGWDVDGPLEVQSEYPVIRDRVDYALMGPGRPELVVEAKAAGSNLSDVSFIAQAVNYGNTLNVPWSVLTNGHEWSLYCVHARRPLPDKLFRHVDLLAEPIDAVANVLSLMTRESVLADRITRSWDAESAGLAARSDGDIRHSTIADETFRSFVKRVEAILGVPLFNEGSRNTFVSGSGSAIQFSMSSPYKGTDNRFIKIRPRHLEGGWFVVWCNDKPQGWLIPTKPLKAFLSAIPLSGRTEGGLSWDPRIGKLHGKDHLWTHRERSGSFEIEGFRFLLS